MYPLIALSDPTLSNLLDEIKIKVGNKLVNCREYFNKNDINAYEDVYLPPYNSTFILSDENSALKNTDRWIVSKLKNNYFEARDRFSHLMIKVPLRCTDRGFRHPSGIPFLNITDKLDYIAIDNFDDAEKIFPTQKQGSQALSTISKWKKIVNDKKSNLLISRRFNLSTPGTRLLAFYSRIPAFGVDMWSVKGLSNEDAKIICLWQNGILCLLQLIIYRTETEGAWLKLHQSQIYDSYILNINLMSSASRTILYELFDEISNEEFPSLIDQLRKRHALRVKLDKTILGILGLSPVESESLISKLYSSVADEIDKLRSIMGG